MSKKNNKQSQSPAPLEQEPPPVIAEPEAETPAEPEAETPAEPEAETPAEPEAETPAEPEAEVVQPAVVKKSDLPEGYETSEAARLRLLREKDEKAAAKKTKEE